MTRKIENEYNYRTSIAFPYDSRDLVWNFDKCLTIIITGLITGFLAGVVGIGGGVILGPILLGFDIYPVVSTVTTNFLVLLTSSSTSIQFILSNLMNYQYAFITTIFSVLGSYFGTKLTHYYFNKSGRQSILIFILDFVIALSAIILPIISTISTIHDINDGKDVFKFNSPCTVK